MPKLNILIKIFLGKKIPISEIRSLIRTIAVRDLHFFYELVIKQIDPLLHFSYTTYLDKKKFIFIGKGGGTLKPYRELNTGTKKLFEKIFLNNSVDLKAIVYFYSNIKTSLNEKNIQTAECKGIIKGEIFTTILYEYLILKPIPNGQVYKILREKTLELYSYSMDRDFADPITFDFFLFGINRLSDYKVFSTLEQAQIKHLIELSPVCFQHLDLSENNVFQNDIIIDWDNSGFFPLGMDFGRLLFSYYIFHKANFLEDYKGIIRDFYKHLHHDMAYKEFHKLTMYFFIVFYYGNTTSREEIRLIEPFLAAFKKLLNNNSAQRTTLSL